MIVNGRTITADILTQVRVEVERMAAPPLLRVVVSEPSPATRSYMRIKSERAREAGITLELIEVPDQSTTEDVIGAVTRPGADAVIVQLPLPEHIDSRRVLDAIPLSLDADVLSSAAYTAFLNAEDGSLLPPVVGAVAEIFTREHIEPAGKKAVVLGHGRLVGQPVAHWLASQGAHVTSITRESGDLSMLADADIVVLGAGSPHLVKPEHLKSGVVVIDAGTSESSGAIVGDADPACAERASVFTPVPGGVGPIAVACLMKNVVELARLRTS